MKDQLGMFGQFFWFSIAALLSASFGYYLLVQYWPWGYIVDPRIPTAQDWHALTIRYLLLAQPGLAPRAWIQHFVNPPVPLLQRLTVVRAGYQNYFDFTWFAGLALVECSALLAAFHLDHIFLWQRMGEGSRMTRTHVTLGCLTWFAVAILCFFGGFLLHQESPPIAKMLDTIGGALLSWGCVLAPVAWLVRRLLKPSRPAQGLSDVRDITHSLQPRKPFDPARYFQPKEGVFIGLDQRKHPVYIPWRSYRAQHKQILGTTGTGKGVVAAVMLAQSIRAGESVIVLDPKDDSKMPGVLAREASQAGVPFTLLDLRAAGPQLNVFAGATPKQVQTLLISGLDLGRKGGEADYYAGQDQDCAEEVAAHATLAGFGMPYIRQSFARRFEALSDPKGKVSGEKFWRSLKQLAKVQCLDTTLGGIDLRAAVNQPGVLYIIGDTADEQVVILQKILLFRIMQLIRERDRDKDHYATVLLDELRFILSGEVLTSLATIRDFKCHVLLCHQSLQDLRNCGSLDPQAVHGAVVENTAIKIVYQTASPDTAQWASRLSGSRVGATASEHMDTTLTGNRGSYQEKAIPLIEENVLLHLPPGMGVIYGVAEARIIQVCPLAMGQRPAIYAAAAEPVSASDLAQLNQAIQSQTPASPAPALRPVAAIIDEEEI